MKFVQASDMHLDSPLHRLPPDLARERRGELRGAFSNLVTHTYDVGADLLLLPGDLFEGEHATRETVAFVKEVLSGLGDTAVFISPGNHDPAGPGSLWSSDFPGNVTIFRDEWTSVEHQGIQVHGYGFTARAKEDNPFRGRRLGPGLHVVVAHADVGAEHSRYAPCSREDVDDLGALWVALGHIHRPTLLEGKGAYAGSLEPLGFDEPGDHGFIAGTLGEGGAQVTFEPCARRRFVELDVRFAGQSAEEWAEALVHAAQGASAEDFLKVTITGSRQAEERVPLALFTEIARRTHPLAEVEDRTELSSALPRIADGVRRRLYTYMAERQEDGTSPALLKDAYDYAVRALEGGDPLED